MKYKAVVFDLDDTLFDREGAQIRVVKLIVQRLPQIFQTHQIERVIEAFIESDRLSIVEFESGAPTDGLRNKRARTFLQLLGINDAYADAINEMYIKDYPSMNMPVSGAVPLVKRISTSVPVAVVSNGLPDVQYKKIETIGLADVFSCIILSEEIGIRKPDHRIFHHAAKLLKVQPSDCLYVGDSYSTDIIGAKTAGMQTCWLNRKSTKPDNPNIQADFVITDLVELNAIL